jgi:Kdo2-lipid IVA lauroyltransferase/acyltransferase
MLLRWFAVAVAALPWRALGWAGAFVGWFAGSVLRIRRGHVEEAMRAAGVEAPARAARGMYRSLGASALELLWLARRGDEATRYVRIDPASEPRWRDALAQGRGVVIAASHTGNWDLAACAVARDVELLVVTKRLSVRSIDGFWQSTRAGRGVRLVDALGAVPHARAALRRGAAVAMMIDQAPASPRHAVRVDFLDRPALVDRAPAALAASCASPLVVAASARSAGGDHVLHVLDVIAPPRRPGRAWIDAATVRATAALDGFVRAHPTQWLWMHRRWKGLEAGTKLAPCRTTPSSSPAAASRAV